MGSEVSDFEKVGTGAHLVKPGNTSAVTSGAGLLVLLIVSSFTLAVHLG